MNWRVFILENDDAIFATTTTTKKRMIWTHHFTHEGNGPPLLEVRRAVNAKRCVFPTRQNTNAQLDIKTGYIVLIFPAGNYEAFTDPGLAHGCLPGSPSWLWNTKSNQRHRFQGRWEARAPFGGVTDATRSMHMGSESGSRRLGWLSAQHATEASLQQVATKKWTIFRYCGKSSSVAAQNNQHTKYLQISGISLYRFNFLLPFGSNRAKS